MKLWDEADLRLTSKQDLRAWSKGITYLELTPLPFLRQQRKCLVVFPLCRWFCIVTETQPMNSSVSYNFISIAARNFTRFIPPDLSLDYRVFAHLRKIETNVYEKRISQVVLLHFLHVKSLTATLWFLNGLEVWIMLSKRLEVRIGSSISVSRTASGKCRGCKRNRFAVKTPMDEITTLLCQINDTKVLIKW